jgi:hypothetical protein
MHWCAILIQTSALSGDGRHLTDLGQKAVRDGLLYVINNDLKSIRWDKRFPALPARHTCNTARRSKHSAASALVTTSAVA